MKQIKANVRSEFNPPPVVGEVNNGPVLVERGGYLPTHVLVPQMLAAGRRLGEHYDELYDALEGQIPDDFVNPLSDNEFDEIDKKTAYDLMEEKLLARKKALAAENEKAEAEKLRAQIKLELESEKPVPTVEEPSE